VSTVLDVAIVGSGPAGFYAAEALIRSGTPVRVTLYERLFAPHGLVRYGVAPDHQKLKSVAAIFERIAADAAVTWLGGVDVGRDVSVDALRAAHHAVILACGSPVGRALGVPGEDHPRVVGSDRVVGWYNGHPDRVDHAPPLDHPVAVVVGLGNVAIDVCRLLCTPVDALAKTDVPPAALEVFAASRVRDVHVVARGGPVEAKCTVKELRELLTLPQVEVRFADRDAVAAALDAAATRPPAAPGPSVADVWRDALAQPPKPDATHRLHLHFHARPVRFVAKPASGSDPGVEARHCAGVDGDVESGAGPAASARDERRTSTAGAVAVHLVDTRVDTRADAVGTSAITIDAGLVITCIGYRGAPPDGVPFDDARGVVPNRAGAVIAASGEGMPDGARRAPLYVTGWLKRGPSGVIGTNRACAVETVATLLAEHGADARQDAKGGCDAVLAQLAACSVEPFRWPDWQRIDGAERARGAAAGSVRVKIASIRQARDAIGDLLHSE
jgi:ferredoxin--NADP+ reductase